eukprot:6485975-Amphidinium_carterae.1
MFEVAQLRNTGSWAMFEHGHAHSDPREWHGGQLCACQAKRELGPCMVIHPAEGLTHHTPRSTTTAEMEWQSARHVHSVSKN